jgi:hypothetical protein
MILHSIVRQVQKHSLVINSNGASQEALYPFNKIKQDGLAMSCKNGGTEEHTGGYSRYQLNSNNSCTVRVVTVYLP